MTPRKPLLESRPSNIVRPIGRAQHHSGLSQRAEIRRRRGTTFYELLTSLLLLVGVIAGVSHCMVTVGRVTREAERYERAVELANIALERATVSPMAEGHTQVWDDRQITGIAYSVQLEVQETEDANASGQISATVSWQNTQGFSREVTLHAWRASSSTRNVSERGGPSA